MSGKQTITGKQYSTDTSDTGLGPLGGTSGPGATSVQGYVVEDVQLFQDVLGAIGTDGSTGFGNSLEQIFDECVSQETGRTMTPLNTDVVKGMDFADGLAGDAGGADVLRLGAGSPTFFAISYKSSAKVDNFDSQGNVNMSANSFQKFLQCCKILRDSDVVSDGDKVAPGLLSAGIDFTLTRNLDFKGLVFRCNLVIDTNASVHAAVDKATSPGVITVAIPHTTNTDASGQQTAKMTGGGTTVDASKLHPYQVVAIPESGNSSASSPPPTLTKITSPAESVPSFNTNLLGGLGTIYTFNLIVTDNFDVLTGKTGEGITRTSRTVKEQLFRRVLSNVNLRNLTIFNQMLQRQGKQGLRDSSDISGLRQVFDPNAPAKARGTPGLPPEARRVQRRGKPAVMGTPVPGSTGGYAIDTTYTPEISPAVPPENVGDPTSAGTTIGNLKQLGAGPGKSTGFRTQAAIDTAAANKKIIEDYVTDQIQELEAECEAQIDSLGAEVFATEAGAKYVAEMQVQLTILSKNFYDKKTLKPNFKIVKYYAPRIFANFALYCTVSAAAKAANVLGIGTKPKGLPKNENRLREFKNTYPDITIDDITGSSVPSTGGGQVARIKEECNQITEELKTQIVGLFETVRKEIKENPGSAEFVLKSLVDHLKQLNETNPEITAEDKRLYESVLLDLMEAATKKQRAAQRPKKIKITKRQLRHLIEKQTK